MTTEEKARAYDEALERARALRQEAIDKEYAIDYVKDYETIFPELAESEDERIRKWLLDFAIGMIAGLELDISRSTYDGIKGHDPESKAELAQWQKARAYLEKQKDLTTENIYKHSRERMSFWDGQQKEQKPAESISQLTVQGKGVYKICPRCKERMVRDDSMVYTSMPPQYRYECPKCGESECDTVMYDNPEMEEQKPNSTEDMPYITDEHFYEREPADSFKYKLAEYMTRCCTKKEGPYGYEYGISAESILKMAEEELLKRGVVQKPAEWSEEDEKNCNRIIRFLEPHKTFFPTKETKEEMQNWLKNRLKSLRPQKLDASKLEDFDPVDVLKRIKKEWPMAWSIFLLSNNDLNDGCPGITGDPDPAGVWKPSEEQMEALKDAVKLYKETHFERFHDRIVSLYEQLKKLM